MFVCHIQIKLKINFDLKNWVDETAVDEIGVDETAVDKIGVDETAVDKTGVDKAARYHRESGGVEVV